MAADRFNCFPHDAGSLKHGFYRLVIKNDDFVADQGRMMQLVEVLCLQSQQTFGQVVRIREVVCGNQFWRVRAEIGQHSVDAIKACAGH